MTIRVASIVLSLAGSFALILGLLFWIGIAPNLISLHMQLGLLAVGALWVIGVAQLLSKMGSWVIAAAALVIGGLTAVLGMTQASIMVGEFHWLIQLVHLALGLLTIGLGHIGAARYRKGLSG